ncbi:hypothetical protein [Pseudomonas sp. Leaf59]|uniref:hypothetical protein n=1 Tax=Pseudomonas sp. Leaf59 TaxID=2876556 RepID=UPI001E2CFBCF|nr:hypothetical protein [Pseudomonas sp. Leaf59]
MTIIVKPYSRRSGLTARIAVTSTGLDPLTVPGVNTADGRGVVAQNLLLAPLKLQIPAWQPIPDAVDDPMHTCEVWWESDDGVRLLDRFYVGAPPPDMPAFYEREISLLNLRSRTRVAHLYYSVRNGSGQTFSNPKVTITIDLERPTLLRPTDRLEFQVPPVPVLDEQYVLDHQPTVFKLPAYNIEAPGDRVEIYLSNSSTPPVAQADGGSPVNFGTVPRTATLNADAFRDLNNGQAYAFFRIFDEAGNFSEMSAGLPFVMGIGLPAPSIRPPAYDDRLIKRDDARAGVFVRIDYPGWSAAAGHQVIVYWDDRPTNAQGVSRLPFEVEIPWPVLRGPKPALAAETVQVRYEVIGLNLSPTPSAPLAVNVNLTIAGQDHANAPALLNPTLAPVEVVGRTGTNLLVNDDRGYPIRVRVRLFDTPRPGDTLQLFWNGDGPVATYSVRAGDVAGSWVNFSDVPAAVLDSTTVTAHAVHYITSNGVNEQRSPVTTVNVRFVPLPAPVVQHTLTNGYLTCRSQTQPVNGVAWSMLANGVRWFIAAHTGLRVGDTIRFKWQGFNENNWSTQNSNVVFERSLRWEPEYAAAGTTIVVDAYDTALYPLRNFKSATGSYEVWRDGVKVGASAPGLVRVDLTYSTGCYCTPRGVVCG